MARGAVDKPIVNFIRGFITEVTGITYPENSVRDVDNCDISLTGRVQRRLGLDYEQSAFSITGYEDTSYTGSGGPYSIVGSSVVPQEELAVTSHRWPAPGGKSGLNLEVIQIGNRLIVRKADTTSVFDPTVPEILEDEFFFDDAVSGLIYNCTRAQAARMKLRSSVGFGHIWFTHPGVLPFYLEYDATTGEIKLEPVGFEPAGEPQSYSYIVRMRDAATNVIRKTPTKTVTNNLSDPGAQNELSWFISVEDGDPSPADYQILRNSGSGWFEIAIVAYGTNEFTDNNVADGAASGTTGSTGFFSQLTVTAVSGQNLFAFGRFAIRDFNGIPDALGVADQPATLSPEHKYNLVNQGWSKLMWDAYFAASDPTYTPRSSVAAGHIIGTVQTTPGAGSRYPSNAQQWILGKDSTDSFDPSLLKKQDFGTSPAPRGRIVIHGLIGDKDGNSGDTTDPAETLDFNGEHNETATGAFRDTCFFAGRVWWTGDQNRHRPNGVYFSKILEKREDAGIYMQVNDPTSEHFPDLQATDGGVIYIGEASSIYRIVPYASGVLVLAENGVWFIYGPESGFKANNFSVEKVSAIGVHPDAPVVDADESVFYWSTQSIHRIVLSEKAVIPASVDIGTTTILSYYQQIDLAARSYAEGVYDPIAQRVVWSWLDSDNYLFPVNQSLRNKMLVLDLRTSAFTKYSFVVDESSVFGLGPMFPSRTPIQTERQGLQLKVMILNGADESLRLAEFKHTGFLDQTPLGLASFDSYLVSGDETLGDIQRYKQATYLHSMFERTETEVVSVFGTTPIYDKPSGCVVVAMWDWHDNAIGGQWSEPQQAYVARRKKATDDPLAVPPLGTVLLDRQARIVYTKLKIRGKGRSLGLKYQSVAEKDFKLIGFSTAFNFNGV